MPSRHLRLLLQHYQHHVLAPSSKHPLRKPIIIPVIATALTFLSVAVLIFFFYWYCKLLKQRNNNKTSPEDGASFKIHRFKYRQLKRATKCFSQGQKLGKGGFGVVYRGLLRNGKEVAVKKLDLSSLQGEREFQNELSICSRLDSPHVVSLLGFCTHGKRIRLLVYECMQNRSLQEALFEEGYPVRLDWGKRFKIILDTAKALEFLHLQCNPPIIHGDVKPSNILLDSNFSARIADFGLARFKAEDFGSDIARISTSTEMFRPDTPERFRFGAPDRIVPGTPVMSRSSTTRNPHSESSYKVSAESPSVRRKLLTKEASVAIDISPTDPPHASGDVVNEDVASCSPNFSHSSVQAGQTRRLPDEGEAVTSPALDSDSRQKAELKVAVDVHKDAPAYGVDDSDVWSKAIPPEGWTKDPRPLPLNRELSFKKASGNDLEWRQDVSEELAGKEYVIDWLGSELCASSQMVCNSKDDEIVSMDEKGSGAKEQKNKSRMGELSTEVVKKERRKAKPMHRKSREWWKDEYFAELNSKNKTNHNVRRKRTKNWSVDNWKDFLTGELGSFSGELRKIDHRSTKEGGRSRSKVWLRNTRSGDLILCRERERRLRVPSIAIDAWNGDLNCQVSGESIHRQWSGDLSKSVELVSRDMSSTTSMRGTVCYVAPEYGGNGILSEKSDIYSFGVLLLVILSGRRPIQVRASPIKEFEKANLISWARTLSQSGKLLDLIDEGLQGEYDHKQANLCITLALLCLQRVPTARPDISEVVKILSGEITPPTLPLELSPSPPARIPYKRHILPPKEHHPPTVAP